MHIPSVCFGAVVTGVIALAINLYMRRLKRRDQLSDTAAAVARDAAGPLKELVARMRRELDEDGRTKGFAYLTARLGGDIREAAAALHPQLAPEDGKLLDTLVDALLSPKARQTKEPADKAGRELAEFLAVL